ncbi:hypothetical protein DSM104443_00611 [Usitatibacter rugosus]|uniref:Big-1 domain-containing protein n=1 Tax=Usitatibacter rugosus TaxID=2732067 RepID=A0A6M4GR01_9PROT|nr:Ig-like domain-containing protein [Usitatibacter rugosus]QJR09562.1 hypothetical protein DSM104443_00611 [Usitatibacter rugosus]
MKTRIQGALCFLMLWACAALAQAATMTPLPGASGQTTAPYTVFPNPVGITLKDDAGQPIANRLIGFSWSFPGDGGAFVFADGGSGFVTAMTNSQGVAISPRLTASSQTGFITITANDSSISLSTPIVLNVAGGRPNGLQPLGGGQSTVVNTAFAERLRLRVFDTSSQPMARARCTFSLHTPTFGVGGSFAGFPGAQSVEVLTDNDGWATSPAVVANGNAGDWFVTGGCQSLFALSTQFNLTNVLASTPVLTAGGPYTVNVGARLTAQVTLRDIVGNVLAGRVVTFEPPTGSPFSDPYGTLDGASAVTDSQGVARMGLVTNNAAGDFTFVARYEGASALVRVTNVRPPEAVALVQPLTSLDRQSTRPGTFFPQRPSVRLLDGLGQPATNKQVIFTSIGDLVAGALFVSPSISNVVSVYTDSQGVATTPPLFATMVQGDSVIAVDVPQLAGGRMYFALETAGLPPVRMEVVSGASQTVAPNSSAQPFVVRVLDVNNQPVPRAEVRWETSGSQSGSFDVAPPTMTGSDGTLTSTPLRVHTVTPFSAFAVCCGAGVRAEFPIAIQAPPAPVAHIHSAGVGDYPFPETDFTFYATVLDANNNRLGGATVSFVSEAVPGSPAAVTFVQATAVTDESGTAAVQVRANDWPGDLLVRAEYNGTSYTASLKIVPRTTLFNYFSIGPGTLQLEGGGPTCTIKSFDRIASRDTGGADAAIPQGFGAPLGYARFQVRHCTAQGRAVVTTPTLIPANGEVWLYGPTADRAAPHWYRAPGGRIQGHSMSFDIMDGGNGDATPASDGDISIPLVAVLAPGAINVDLYPQVQDMWWSGPSENGWGMSVVQHSENLFAVIYGYDAAGAPTWWVMSSGTWNAARTIYSGSLYSPRGSPFYAYDAARFAVGAPVGILTLDFTDPANARMSYTVNGVAGSKAIVRQVFGSPAPSPQEGVGDMWWGGTAQNGWGLSVLQQYSTLFPVWFTYDAAGMPVWYVMPGGTWVAGNYEGRIYRTTGSPWLGAAYDPAAFRIFDVGSYRLRFDGAGTTFESTVDGRGTSVSISRTPF